jgi:hypothetical protein
LVMSSWLAESTNGNHSTRAAIAYLLSFMAPPLVLEAVEGRDSWRVYTREGGASAKNIVGCVTVGGRLWSGSRCP